MYFLHEKTLKTWKGSLFDYINTVFITEYFFKLSGELIFCGYWVSVWIFARDFFGKGRETDVKCSPKMSGKSLIKSTKYSPSQEANPRPRKTRKNPTKNLKIISTLDTTHLPIKKVPFLEISQALIAKGQIRQRNFQLLTLAPHIRSKDYIILVLKQTLSSK
jgi:hypothetical protein